MRLAAKLGEWQAAGLIDATSAEAILAHEEGRQRPVALFAVVGLGLLALALGLLSLVASNWDAISAALKLASHVLSTAIAAAAAIYFAGRERSWLADGALFLLAALTLAGIALQSQVYQLTGALWQALAWWAVLMTPALLLLGRTRLIAYGLGLMLVALAIAYRVDTDGILGENLTMALPAALAFAALVLPSEAETDAFRKGLLDIGLAIALVAGTLAQIGWVTRVSHSGAVEVARSLPLAVIMTGAAALVAFRHRPAAEARLIVAILGGSLIAVLLALGMEHGEGAATRFLGLLTFSGLWGGVAVLAARAGWHRLFGIAVAALAQRLFIVYFELFYSLAVTGVGLIIGGLLLIGLAWGWRRIVRAETG